MSEEKDILESQSSIELFGDEMSADRAQNMKGTAKRFFQGSDETESQDTGSGSLHHSRRRV